MSRINFTTIADDGTEQLGWFDPNKCEQWEPGRTFDGENRVLNTVSDYAIAYDTLYRTPGGRWIREVISRRAGVADSYDYLTDDQARDWLIRAEGDGTEEAIERFFGELPDESPAIGRPSIGDARDIKLLIPVELLGRIDDAADSAGVSRAEWLRTAAEQALSS